MTQSGHNLGGAKPPLRLVLANPRGFCAGVDRAVEIVERALAKFGGPVYVRHEIVHNRRVVDDLAAKGAVFVEEIDDVPDNVPVIFSAHGVPKSVPAAAQARGLNWLDATCPLVSKVHIEVERHVDAGRHILLIGHAGHPEIVGTMGQVPSAHITLIETEEDARTVFADGPTPALAYATQTTLSLDDTHAMIEILTKRFPDIAAPHREDICYATTNRQHAVKRIADQVDGFFVIGAANSSNSQRLVEVADRAGCAYARLIDDAAAIDWAALSGMASIGLTAGASAPERIVEEVIAALSARFELRVEEDQAAAENVHFKLPRSLRETDGAG